MPVAVDSSSPIRFAGTPAQPGTITSAAFTAPAGSLIVVGVSLDSDGGGQNVTMSVSDSGGLTWTEWVRRDNAETTAGGFSSLHTAVAPTSASRTVAVLWTSGAAGGSDQMSAKVLVFTGADVAGTPVQSVAAANEGGSATNSVNTSSLTPDANGVLVVNDTEWTAAGAFQASSDLTLQAAGDTADYGANMSVYTGYKSVTNGVACTGNLNAAGSGSVQHKWVQILIREAAATVTSLPPVDPNRRMATMIATM